MPHGFRAESAPPTSVERSESWRTNRRTNRGSARRAAYRIFLQRPVVAATIERQTPNMNTEGSVMSASADRNLLFGILALQMDFVSRDQLVAAMNAWVLAKHRPLADILAEQGALQADHRTLLDALVQAHLAQHGNDAEKSLAALSSLGAARKDLQGIADADLQA